MLRAIVLLLTCAAGSVDAASFAALGHVFTANMTGNTIHLGVSLGRWDTTGIVRTGIVLAAFAVGVAIGAAIVEREDSTEPWPPAVTAALALELALLLVAEGAWALGWAPRLVGQHALLALLATAMGVQSAAVRRLRISGVVTTYITGTVTSFVAGEVRRQLGRNQPTPEAPTRTTPLLGLVWLVYALGAVVTAWWASAGNADALLLPIVLLAAAIAGAIRHRR